MTHSEYMREMNLMKKQNDTEYDMYSVIATLIRKGKNIKNLSLRDVNRRRKKTKRGRVFYGFSSMPDFAILDETFINTDDWREGIKLVYGCVEIKSYNSKLYTINDILRKVISQKKLSLPEAQLLGEILWYKKVLYTNGTEWKYLRYVYDDDIQNQLLSIVEKQYERVDKEEQKKPWYLNMENNMQKIKIEEKDLTPNKLSEIVTDDEWNAFLSKLYGIEWKE